MSTVANKYILQKILAGVSLLLFTTSMPVAQENELSARQQDPHYTDAGFFDIHVCNWQDRPMFFMTLFSTYHFKDIKRIDIYNPDGRHLSDIGMQRFRVINSKDKPEKRVFLKQVSLPESASNGWYRSVATMKDGKKIEARDYVVIDRMPWAQNASPVNGAADIQLPKELKWKAVPGAAYYQVFIKDLWESEKVILSSKLLNEPRLKLKPGLLKADGWYSWRIHARDVNGHILLGDFNQGSLGPEMKFTTAPAE